MDNALINRLNELAERSYNENRFLFTDFLDLSQLSIYYNMKKDLEYVGTSVSGGTDGCERCIIKPYERVWLMFGIKSEANYSVI